MKIKIWIIHAILPLNQQTMSRKVANGLDSFRPKESKATSKYIRVWDNFFDCANVRSTGEGVQKGKPFLYPYSLSDGRWKEATEKRFHFLSVELPNYFLKWKKSIEATNQPALHKQKMFMAKPTWVGLQMTANSIVGLTKFLLENGADYVLTERFSQDPVERNFGVQRSMNRRGSNPSFHAFQQNTRIIRDMKVFLPIKGSNVCAELQEEPTKAKQQKLE